jgi:hypothetical protein
MVATPELNQTEPQQPNSNHTTLAYDDPHIMLFSYLVEPGMVNI